MKNITIGIFAHVDAGKTTLSEALLLEGGMIRKAGRVDHGDAFLDTHSQERARGITIFSKQALIENENMRITLMDTPGHVDFAAEAERVLWVLDAAVLLISATDGVQSHTRTLWNLLSGTGIPVFVFFNKTDIAEVSRKELQKQVSEELGGTFVDFNRDPGLDDMQEELALCDDDLAEQYLEGRGPISAGQIRELIRRRKVFPCYFGSALHMEGIGDLLDGLKKYAPEPLYNKDFGARIFKIARDEKQNRLTFLKVTGGSLTVRSLIPEYNEKITQIRLYSGSGYRDVKEIKAGEVAAVTGVSLSKAGDILGCETKAQKNMLEPVLSCQVILPDGTDHTEALSKLRILEEEDPSLAISFDEENGDIGIRLMGKVQTEILEEVIRERFGFQTGFSEGRIIYRETITAPVEGIGHFEPLRHYAEVHVVISPGERDSGVIIADECMPDILEPHWRRLIMSQLAEKNFRGVLTGSSLTDVKIALVSGKAHLKHTESGDFREAAYRAVRCGLMQAESILLEPWQELSILVPEAFTGRAMSDIERMGGQFDPAAASEGMIPKGFRYIKGFVPVSESLDYAEEVRKYSKGEGQVFFRFCGYRPCHDQEEVISAFGYDPSRDIKDPADSVFCSHGAGHSVPWDHVREYMHLDAVLPV